MELKEKLQTLRIDALQQVESAEDLQALNQVRISYLGKKGPITEALRGMKDLSPEERPVIGTLANELRDDIEAAIQAKKDALEIKKMEAEIAAETIDVTLPGKKNRPRHDARPDADQRRNRGSIFGHGLQDRGRPRSGTGQLQFRKDESSERSSGPRYAGYFLHHR